GSCLEDGLELSSLVTQTLPGSSCEAEIYAVAMAAQELRWLTYLLTDLGEAPRSPPVLSSCEAEIYAVAMAAQELRWLTYLLTDLGEAPRSPPVLYANTVDVFTKALQPCDHQPCFAFLDWSSDLLFSPTLPMGVFQTY
ncbi:unnamed protein product, partial [Closterium sp. NIES-53]